MFKRIILTVTNDLVYDQRMHRIANTLQKSGYEVELVGRVFINSQKITKQIFKQKRLRCLFTKGVLFYAEFNFRLFLYLLFNSFDIVCGCDLDTLSAAVLAAKLKGKKVVYDAHEYFPESPELIGKPFKQSVWNLIEKIFIPGTDAMYTVTNSIAQIFSKKYKVDCKLVRNLPLKSESRISTLNSPVLLYQGAVNIGRGLNEMLLVMLKMDNLCFHIAGDGDEMQHVKNTIKELKLEGKVKLLGKKSPEELKEITSEAYIGINLLENRGLSYYYSLGNKTFDYIQAGIPQIMIGFPEYIELNNQYNIGLVVRELTVENIYSVLTKLLTDKNLYLELQKNCLRAAEVLCWENEEKNLLSIYDQL